jgi:hypothetical protein
MPRCIVCKTLLHSQLFPEDEEIRKCVFCIRGQNIFESGDLENGFKTYNKQEMEKEYLLYLQELSGKANISKILTKCESENNEK